MKKKLKILGCFCFLAIMVASFVFLFSNRVVSVNLVIENTSELRMNFYCTESSFCHAEVYSGKREQSFEYDGISTDKVDFCIVKVEFDDRTIQKEYFDATVILNDITYSIRLEKNPFENSYMGDLGVELPANSCVTLKILDDRFEQIELENISKHWKIDYEKAIKIACTELKSFIKQNSKNGFGAECYLKIANNHAMLNKYFWTFSIKTRNMSTASVVVDVESGEILFKSF